MVYKCRITVFDYGSILSGKKNVKIRRFSDLCDNALNQIIAEQRTEDYLSFMNAQSAVFGYIGTLLGTSLKKALFIVILPAAGGDKPDSFFCQSVYKFQHSGRQALFSVVEKSAVQITGYEFYHIKYPPNNRFIFHKQYIGKSPVRKRSFERKRADIISLYCCPARRKEKRSFSVGRYFR